MNDKIKKAFKVFDKDDHPGLFTGIRAVYKIYPPVECPRCGKLTDRVFIYLGSKHHDCLCGNSWRNDNIIL